MVHENQLRRRIAELQEYRRVGITTGYEAESYDTVKAARAGFRPVVSREQTDPIRTGARINAGQNRFLHGTPPLTDSRGVSRDPPPARPRAPTKPKDLRSAEGIELLTPEEAVVASHTHVEPKKFQQVKAAMIIRNEAQQGRLRRREARSKHHIDVNNAARIWDFLVMTGQVKLAFDQQVKAFDLKHGEKGYPTPPMITIPAGGPTNPLPLSMIFANGSVGA
jgi:transcriptional adapter 2-alpha